jgi:hypothetical protein
MGHERTIKIQSIAPTISKNKEKVSNVTPPNNMVTFKYLAFYGTTKIDLD